jgi:hypothetical protein
MLVDMRDTLRLTCLVLMSSVSVSWILTHLPHLRVLDMSVDL